MLHLSKFELAHQRQRLGRAVLIDHSLHGVPLPSDERDRAAFDGRFDDPADKLLIGQVVGLDQNLFARLELATVADEDVGQLGDT